MTTSAIITAELATPVQKSDAPTERGRQSFARQVFIDTFAKPGACVGAIWIFLLVLGAVFAPFIASSFPFAVKMNGEWSSPLLAHLGSSDVTLLVGFLTAAILLATRRVGFPTAIATVVWFVALAVPITNWHPLLHHWPFGTGHVSMAARILIVSLIVIDVGVLVLIAAASQATSGFKMGCGVVALLLGALFVALPVDPPENVVWDQYRAMEAAGQLQSVYRTVVPYSANDYQRDVPDARIQPPSRQHWMGTEGSGADVFSRMLHASRIALAIGFIATGISVSIGITVGGLMGYFAGTVDILGMRIIEIFEAIPSLILLLTVCAFFGRNLYLMMAIIGLLSWTNDARFIRGEFFRLRKQDFVQAAIASGLPLRSVIFRHMLPNGITPVLVNSSFNVASAILLESTLSFLGLGLVDQPSWGQLLEQARAGGTGFIWWIALYPGLAIFLTVFAYNLIGEALRDALDPKIRKKE